VFDETYRCLLNTLLYAVLISLTPRGEMKNAPNFFADKRGSLNSLVGSEEARSIYSSVMQHPIATFDMLKQKLLEINEKCIPANRRLLLEYQLANSNSSVKLDNKLTHEINYKSSEMFSLRVKSHDPVVVSQAILQELGDVCGQIYYFWIRLTDLVLISPYQIKDYFLKEYLSAMNEYYLDSFITTHYSTPVFEEWQPPNTCHSHTSLINFKRSS
jgi:hypothetical protein